MTTARICAIVALPLLVAACGRAPAGNSAAGNESPAAAPAGAASNAAATAAASSNGASAAPGAGPLTAYLGKLTSDKVGGATFLERPEVRSAVETLVADAAARRWILNPDSTQSPIAQRGSRIYSSACEPHNCGPHQWSIAIGADGSSAEICYHDDRQDETHSRWYAAGRPPETRPGLCDSA